MTLPAEGVVASATVDGAKGHQWRRQLGRNRAWVALIPAVVTFGVMLYQIGRPSLWQDEVSTLSDSERSLPALFHLLGHLDAVHSAYYLFMWVVIRVAGTSAVVLRFPSAVGMAVAAGAITLLGQRLVSTRAGLAAGLVFAALPQMSWYGQEARSYALVAAFATIATYLFVRLEETGPGTRSRWLAAYGACLALMGLLNLFALLLVAAHGVALAAHLRSAPSESGEHLSPSRSAAGRGFAGSLTAGWLTAVIAAFVVVSPVVFMGWRERGQIAWLKAPNARTLVTLQKLIGPPNLLVAIAVIIAAAIAIGVWQGRGRRQADWPRRLVTLCLPWLIIPPLILILASYLHPVYVQRYIVFCVPAAALLVGAGLAALGRVAAPLGLALIVVLVLPAQAQARTPGGHGENLRRVSSIVAARSRPGDSVLFASSYVRKVKVAYPGDYRSLRDIALGETALQAARPAGLNAPMPVVDRRLATVNRVWVIEITSKHEVLPPLRKLGFVRLHKWDVHGYLVAFYARPTAAHG